MTGNERLFVAGLLAVSQLGLVAPARAEAWKRLQDRTGSVVEIDSESIRIAGRYVKATLREVFAVPHRIANGGDFDKTETSILIDCSSAFIAIQLQQVNFYLHGQMTNQLIVQPKDSFQRGSATEPNEIIRSLACQK